MQSGIHQRSKQRCKEKCWKVQGRRGNCFFFWCSYTWNDYETEAFPLVSSLVSGKEVFYMVKAKQANKSIQHTHLISGQK